VPDCDEEIAYSTAFEYPAPATAPTIEPGIPPMVPAVSVTAVWVPKAAKTKSLSAAVVTLEMEGIVDPLQALIPDGGGVVDGSKGETVSAPETPKAIPEAEVGAAPNVTVMVSVVTADEAIPYHSYLVVSWAPEHVEGVVRAEPCHDIFDWLSDTELIAMVVPDL